MSLVVILVLALVLTAAGRLPRFAGRIALLTVLIALAVNYGAHVTRRQTAGRHPPRRSNHPNLAEWPKEKS